MLRRLRIGEAFNTEVQLQVDQPCQNIPRNFIPEMSIPEELDQYGGPSAGCPEVFKKIPVRINAIDQLGNLADKPLIWGLIAAAVSPPRVWIRARQQRAPWRLMAAIAA